MLTILNWRTLNYSYASLPGVSSPTVAETTFITEKPKDSKPGELKPEELKPEDSKPQLTRKRKTGVDGGSQPFESHVDTGAQPFLVLPQVEEEKGRETDTQETDWETDTDCYENIDYSKLKRVTFIQRKSRSDFNFQACIVGDVNVGKTTLLLSICNETKHAKTKVGVSSKETTIFCNAKHKSARVVLKDTGGQERHRELTTTFYRDCIGCLVLFNVCNEHSFNHVHSWLQDINMYGEAGICILLVGAKFGKVTPESRSVSEEEGRNLAIGLDVTYIEADICDNEDARGVLEKLVELMIQRVDKREPKYRAPFLSPSLRKSRRSVVTKKDLDKAKWAKESQKILFQNEALKNRSTFDVSQEHSQERHENHENWKCSVL